MKGNPKDLMLHRIKFANRQVHCENTLAEALVNLLKNNDLDKFLPLARGYTCIPDSDKDWNPREISLLIDWKMEYPFVLGDYEYDKTYEDQWRVAQYKAAIHFVLFNRSYTDLGIVTSFSFKDSKTTLSAIFDTDPNKLKAPEWFRPHLIELLKFNKQVLPDMANRTNSRKARLKGKGVAAGMKDWA